MKFSTDENITDKINDWLLKNKQHFDACVKGDYDKSVLGWWDIQDYANDKIVNEMIELAGEIRKDCDVLLLCGVGGSNGAARSVIEYFKSEINIEVRYIGNNLSAKYITSMLSNLEGKKVYANVIAKDFHTLEPGITFRLLRDFYNKRGENPSDYIVLTGTINSRLHEVAKVNGYNFLEFPKEIGGRFSGISAVGLFPLAVCGLNIKELVLGAASMREKILSSNMYESDMAKYVATRHIMVNNGFKIENLCCFEPELSYLSKWWLQLFGESEGKCESALLPYACNYSEDLHAIGQYIQDGRKDIFETFLKCMSTVDFKIRPDTEMIKPSDEFEYLDNKNFSELNLAVFEGTKSAHQKGGVPVIVLDFGEITMFTFGEIFYFFFISCFFSCLASGVNPFDQPGVEAYKKDMYAILKK